MTQVYRYIIALIRALMQDRPLPPVPEGISLGELFSVSKAHGIQALVFRGLNELQPDCMDPVWKQWENQVNQLLAQSVVQLQERDELIDIFTRAEMDVLPVKGCWLKELYPDINDRQMSDLDMLVREEDVSRAEVLLLERGYRKDEVGFHHTVYRQAPYLVLELHTSLLPKIDEHRSYYEDVWNRATAGENPRLYRLKPEDAYIYYLVHLNMHLSEGGSGIRSILDNCIYLRAHPYMDQAYLDRELDTLGLSPMARQVQALSHCWFETGQEIPEELQSFAQAVCEAGTYGFWENRVQNRMEHLAKRYPNPVIRFFAYCLPRFFLPMPTMKRRYPILEKLPVLLPFCWAARVASMMLHNEDSFWQHLGLLFRKGECHG